jgi:metallo-beta-lactamase family protein
LHFACQATEAQPVPIIKHKAANNNPTYDQLLLASERLYRLIKASSGRANADMRRMAEKINKLCDKWEI